MDTTAPDRSITCRTSPRPDLLIFDFHGEITKPDIEWMAGIANAAFDRLGEVDMLLVLSGYDGPRSARSSTATPSARRCVPPATCGATRWSARRAGHRR